MLSEGGRTEEGSANCLLFVNVLISSIFVSNRMILKALLIFNSFFFDFNFPYVIESQSPLRKTVTYNWKICPTPEFFRNEYDFPGCKNAQLLTTSPSGSTDNFFYVSL